MYVYFKEYARTVATDSDNTQNTVCMTRSLSQVRILSYRNWFIHLMLSVLAC